MTAAPPTWKLWTALGIVYVVWGSTYLAIRYVVESLPPLLSASVRFSLASLVLATYLVARRGRRALAATRRQYANAGLIGLLANSRNDCNKSCRAGAIVFSTSLAGDGSRVESLRPRVAITKQRYIE